MTFGSPASSNTHDPFSNPGKILSGETGFVR
jgi:hypothetical protein